MKKSEELQKEINKLQAELDKERRKESDEFWNTTITLRDLLSFESKYLAILNYTDKDEWYETELERGKDITGSFIEFISDKMSAVNKNVETVHPHSHGPTPEQLSKMTTVSQAIKTENEWIPFDWDFYSKNKENCEVRFRGISNDIKSIERLSEPHFNNQSIKCTDERNAISHHSDNGIYCLIADKKTDNDILMKIHTNKALNSEGEKLFDNDIITGNHKKWMEVYNGKWTEFNFDLYKKYKENCRLKFRDNITKINSVYMMEGDIGGQRITSEAGEDNIVNFHNDNGRINMNDSEDNCDILMKITLPF